MLTLHREVCTRSDSRKHTRTHARRHRAAGDPPDSPRSWLAPFLCCPFPSPTAPLPSCVVSQVTHRLVSACLTTDTPKAPTARCPAAGWGQQMGTPPALPGAPLPQAGPQRQPRTPTLSLSHQRKQQKLKLGAATPASGRGQSPQQDPFYDLCPTPTLWIETFCLWDNERHF